MPVVEQNFQKSYYYFVRLLLWGKWTVIIFVDIDLVMLAIFRKLKNYYSSLTESRDWQKGQSRHFYTRMFYIEKICACVTWCYSSIYTIYKFLDMLIIGNLHWGYPLINCFKRYSEFGHMPFLERFSVLQLLTWNFILHTSHWVEVWT